MNTFLFDRQFLNRVCKQYLVQSIDYGYLRSFLWPGASDSSTTEPKAVRFLSHTLKGFPFFAVFQIGRASKNSRLLGFWLHHKFFSVGFFLKKRLPCIFILADYKMGGQFCWFIESPAGWIGVLNPIYIFWRQTAGLILDECKFAEESL